MGRGEEEKGVLHRMRWKIKGSEREAREEEEECNEVWWSSRQHLKQPEVHAVIQFVSCSQNPSCLHFCAVQETSQRKHGGGKWSGYARL